MFHVQERLSYTVLKKRSHRVLLSRFALCIRTCKKYRSLLCDSSPFTLGLYTWWNHMLSIYLLFLLCIAGLATSAPTIHHHPQLDSLGSFPYGKLADKLLNVNHVSYTIDDLDEYWVGAYPENHSTPFSSINSFELPLPNVDAKNLFSFFYRLPDIIKKVVTQEWETTALVRWRMMARDHSRWTLKYKCNSTQVSSKFLAVLSFFWYHVDLEFYIHPYLV